MAFLGSGRGLHLGCGAGGGEDPTKVSSLRFERWFLVAVVVAVLVGFSDFLSKYLKERLTYIQLTGVSLVVLGVILLGVDV